MILVNSFWESVSIFHRDLDVVLSCVTKQILFLCACVKVFFTCFIIFVLLEKLKLRSLSLQVFVLICAQAHVFVIIFHQLKRTLATRLKSVHSKFTPFTVLLFGFMCNCVFRFVSFLTVLTVFFQSHVWTQNVRSCRWNAVHLIEVEKLKYGTVRFCLNVSVFRSAL